MFIPRIRKRERERQRERGGGKRERFFTVIYSFKGLPYKEHKA